MNRSDPWTWLAHQWWFIAGLLVVGLVAGQVAEKEVGNWPDPRATSPLRERSGAAVGNRCGAKMPDGGCHLRRRRRSPE